jgi:hypothetical protein
VAADRVTQHEDVAEDEDVLTRQERDAKRDEEEAEEPRKAGRRSLLLFDRCIRPLMCPTRQRDG